MILPQNGCPSGDPRERYYDIRVAHGLEVVATEPILLKGRHSFAFARAQGARIAATGFHGFLAPVEAMKSPRRFCVALEFCAPDPLELHPA